MDDLSFLLISDQPDKPDPAALDLAVEAGMRAAEALQAAQAAALSAPSTRPERLAWAVVAAAAITAAGEAIEDARGVASRVPLAELAEVYAPGFLDGLSHSLEEARRLARFQASKAFISPE